jgi:uncharacterized secreted protein with C-terminal beta-propeller domain
MHRNDLVQHDLTAVPKIVEILERQLHKTGDHALRLELEQSLTHRRHQLAALEQLQQTTLQAKFQLDNTLSLLGAIYTQLLTEKSTDQIADYGRLSADIEESRHGLQDQLAALGEVRLA